MTGPFELVGADDAPVCVDGVCALPDAAIGDAPDQGLERTSTSG